jgi:hypothetical protein
MISAIEVDAFETGKRCATCALMGDQMTLISHPLRVIVRMPRHRCAGFVHPSALLNLQQQQQQQQQQ